MDKPCGELALENCMKIISDKPNSLGMFLGIQSDIYMYTIIFTIHLIMAEARSKRLFIVYLHLQKF